MTGLMDPQLVKAMPAVESYLEYAAATKRILDENYQHVSDHEKRLNLAIEENVLVQLENLRTHPSVAAATGRGDLGLHGWVYKFESGDVTAFDPTSGQFLPVEQIESDEITKPPRVIEE